MNESVKLFDEGKHYESGVSAAIKDKQDGKISCGFLYPRRYSDNTDWRNGYDDEYNEEIAGKGAQK